MQIAKMGYLNQRANYYLARTTHGQLTAANPYTELKPSFVIFFLVHDFFKAPPQDHHFTFFMQEKRQRVALAPYMTMHFVEIPKLIGWINDRKDQTPENDLEIWCRFMYNPNDPIVLEAAMEKNDFKKARERVEFLEGDRESIDIINKRQVALRIRGTPTVSICRTTLFQQIIILCNLGYTHRIHLPLLIHAPRTEVSGR